MISPTSIFAVETWIIIGTLLFLIRYYLHRKWQFLKNINVPHDPPSVLGFGHLRDFMNKKKMLTLDGEMKKKYGPIWGLYIGVSPTIVVHDPDVLKQIMIKDFPSFPCRRGKTTTFGADELSEAVSVVVGDRWKRQRATLSPSFTGRKLREMRVILDSCTNEAVKVLQQNCDGQNGVFDPIELYTRLSLEMVCSAAFSTKIHSQDPTEEEPEFVKHAKIAIKGDFGLLLIIAAFFPMMGKLFEKLGIKLSNSADSFLYFRDIAKEVMEQHRNTGLDEQRVDLMTEMLKVQISDDQLIDLPEKGVTQNEIIGNCMLYLIAGSLTTTTSLYFFTYNVAVHPEVQRRLHEEIDEAIEKHGKLDYEGISSLKFLDMCLNESLRLYGPTTRNARFCTKDVNINGLKISKGTQIFIPAFDLSHDPEFWDKPMEFQPERMENMSQINQIIFQPFGAGPRNCIGKRFAILEIKVAMTRILQNFSIEPTEDTPKPPLKLVVENTLKPEKYFKLRVVPRSGKL